MDHDDCLRIRLDVVCSPALIGDLDVEKIMSKFTQNEKCRGCSVYRHLSEYGQFSPNVKLKTTCLCYSLMVDVFLFIVLK